MVALGSVIVARRAKVSNTFKPEMGTLNKEAQGGKATDPRQRMRERVRETWET